MTQPEAVFFDCDGTLVDSEVICSRAYVHMFREFGITLDLDEIFKRFKGILVDDSSAGAQSGIAAGMEVFYFCADPHNKPIEHPKVTTFTRLEELPELWQARGWNITR